MKNSQLDIYYPGSICREIKRAIQRLTELAKMGDISFTDALNQLTPWQVMPVPAPRGTKVPKRRRPVPTPRKKKIVLPDDDPIWDELFGTQIPTPRPRSPRFVRTPYSIQNYLRDWVLRPRDEEADAAAFLGQSKDLIRKKLVEEILDLKGVKFSIALRVSLHKEKNYGTSAYADPPFWSTQQAVLKAADVDDALDNAIAKVLLGLENYMRDGSGWAIDRVLELFLNIARYQPLRGGSYIDLPASIKKKHAIVNVKNG